MPQLAFDHMPRKALIGIGASMNAVAACAIGLYQVKDAVIAQVDHNAPGKWLDLEQLFSIALMLGVVLIIASIPLFIIAAMLRAVHITVPFFQEDLTCRVCQKADLDDVFRIARDEFGERSSSRDNIARLHDYNPQSFWIVKAGGPVGYFILYSLKAAGERAILSGYYNGANPACEHIQKQLKKGTALCIGAVVGRGVRGRAATFSAMTAILESMPHARLYGKPVTADGLRVALKYGCESADDHPELGLERYCRMVR